MTTTTNATRTYTATPRPGRDFMKGVKNAKVLHGTFDGSTWSLPADFIDKMRGENYTVTEYLQRNYLRLVTPATRCTQYTVDQGCPLHGEFCRA